MRWLTQQAARRGRRRDGARRLRRGPARDPLGRPHRHRLERVGAKCEGGHPAVVLRGRRGGARRLHREARRRSRVLPALGSPGRVDPQDDGSGGTSAFVSPSGRRPPRARGAAIRRRSRRPSPGPTAPRGSRTRTGKITGAASGTATSTTCRSRLRAPRSAASRSLSTGRKISNPADTRVVEAVVRQSTITDFQEIADGDIGWGSGATSYGLIYANGNITWNGGTAYGSNYASGKLSRHASRGSDGATGYDGDGSTSYTNLFAPPSPLTHADRLQHVPDLVLGHRERRGRLDRRWDLPRLELRRRGG